MRQDSAWVIAILLLPVCAMGLRAEDEGEKPSKPDVQFVAPGEARNSTTDSETAQDAGEATFINPENAQPEEGAAARPKAGEQNAAELNHAVLKNVHKKAVRQSLKPANPDDPAEEIPDFGPVEPATNTGFAPGLGQKEESAAAGDTKPGDVKAKIDEKGPQDAVKGGFSTANPQGALAYFKGKTLLETSFYQAVQRAIDKNLSVKFADKGYERSGFSVTKAKAAFDPVFSLSINGTQTDTFERREFISRRRFIAGELQNEIVDAIFNTTEAQEPNDPVEGFQRRGAFERTGSRARFRSETITESFAQQLPWGSIFSLNFTQKQSKTIFQEFTLEDSFTINDSETGLDPNGQVQPILDSDGITTRKRSVFFEQHGRIARDRQQRPWTSGLSVRLVVPIPYTKDWGPYGPAEVPIKLTETAHERAYWDLQSTINNTLLSVNLSYWNVVRAVRRLELTIKTRQGMENVVQKTEDMLKANRKTALDKTQAMRQLSTIRGGEQSEWANYVAASNALKSLLDEDKDTVILPVAYGEMLGGTPPVTVEEAMAISMANNPDLQSAKVAVKLSDISLKFAHNQARPDLKLTTGMTWSQSSANYGYSGVGPAMAALMRPDQRDSFAILNYRVPWGNKPALERVNEAEERYKQAQKTLQLVTNQVDRKIHDAMTALNSARERADLTEKNKEIADGLFKLELDKIEGEKSTLFELVKKNTDMLNAGFRAIDAQIDVKQQEAQLLAAEGTLASRYTDEFKITLKQIEDPRKKDDEKKKDEKKKDEEKKIDEKKDEPKKGAENEADKEPVAPVAAKEQK